MLVLVLYTVLRLSSQSLSSLWLTQRPVVYSHRKTCVYLAAMLFELQDEETACVGWFCYDN